MEKIKKIVQKLGVFGFSGPKYSGLAGKIRLVLQELFFHKEIILVAVPESFVVNNDKMNPDVSIKVISSYQDCKDYIRAFEAAYYVRYTDAWPRHFEAGEKLVLAFDGNKVAGFVWLQQGTTVKGTYYIRLLKDECRTYREGVFPEFRGKKIYSTMKSLILENLFQNGATRVYVDVFKDNIPSLKAQLNAGFKEFGEISVVNIPFSFRKFIRWS